ncbi:MAG TPA: hypothetical protein VMA83_02050 [Solirubrobacteraceae bacterium]|nr:hypothetical protein [Solirubrobacteraceae bacterium]
MSTFPPVRKRRAESPESETRRARIIVVVALIGIVATLVAYAVSPSVRHVVSHAEHSVSGVFDHDHDDTQTSTSK